MDVGTEARKSLKPGPDFVCFGLQKAGTQWLYDQMDSCSQVWMTPIKELNYFVGDMYKQSNSRALKNFLNQNEQTSSPAEDAFFSVFQPDNPAPRDIDWYKSLFEPKGPRISGDISPIYATANSVDVERIYGSCPQAKYIFLLRHPVDRLWSALCMHARKGRIKKDDLKDWRSVKVVISHKGYIKRSYPSQIWKRWTTFVPANSIRYWFLDDIIADPEQVRREILSFVGMENPQFSLPAGHNRKSGKQKMPMPDDVRVGLFQTFQQEIEDCATVFGGAAVKWRR